MRDVAAASERLKKDQDARRARGDRRLRHGLRAGFAYLRQFSADSLKIDRTFIAGITSSRESAAIIHALVELGKLLGIETLAEGIEDPNQLVQLQQERCDHGQGFLFAHPSDGGRDRGPARGRGARPGTLSGPPRLL